MAFTARSPQKTFESMEELPNCPLYTKGSMARIWAIEDTCQAYSEEMDWHNEWVELRNKFRIRKDPSAKFVTARKVREFEQWYPVSHSMTL